MKHTKNSMRGNAALWCILACLLLLLPASAGAVERNYLTSQFTEAEVSAALVPCKTDLLMVFNGGIKRGLAEA